MDKLTQFGYPFVLVVEQLKEALRLHDMQIPVMLGKLDDAKTFEDAGIQNCAMVVPQMTIYEMSILPSVLGKLIQRVL